MGIQSDHSRFKDIIRGKIKEDFKKYITHEEMIGRQENDYVKIPIPKIKIPKFVYGPKQSGGVGQGQGKPGDSVSESGQENAGEGPAGDQEGQHHIEVEMSFDDLAEILGEELELPHIQPKGKKVVQNETQKYKSISNVGPQGLRHFKRTYKEALKRYISTDQYDPNDPILVPIKQDMRFRSPKLTTSPQSNAVVIYMMDVSGSMGEEQKKIVRLESFWINTWLKKNYKGLETRFIIHDASAKEVDEDTFFRTSESGGTLISSAYKKCLEIIEQDYPINDWNIYTFHFSDGDNWSGEDTKLCLDILKSRFLPIVNMFGYGQVESKYGSGQFIKDLNQHFENEERIIRSHIKDRSKIIKSIKDFLGKGH